MNMVEWTLDMDFALRKSLMQRRTWAEIAKRIGVHENTATDRAKLLGLSRPRCAFLPAWSDGINHPSYGTS